VKKMAITSEFTFDEINTFIKTLDEMYELAKYKFLFDNSLEDKEILMNCKEARREMEAYRSSLTN